MVFKRFLKFIISSFHWIITYCQEKRKHLADWIINNLILILCYCWSIEKRITNNTLCKFTDKSTQLFREVVTTEFSSFGQFRYKELVRFDVVVNRVLKNRKFRLSFDLDDRSKTSTCESVYFPTVGVITLVILCQTF